MFVALEGLVRAAGKLSLSFKMDGDKMVVVLMPQGDSKEATLRQPLILAGTPAELDEKFVEAVQSFSSARKSLDEQVAATTAILQSAETAQAGKAKTALAKGNKSALPAPASKGGDDEQDEDDTVESESSTAPAPAAPDQTASSGTDLFSLLS